MKLCTAGNRPVHPWVEESILQVGWSSGFCDEHQGGTQLPEVLPAPGAVEIQGRNFLLYSSSTQDGSTALAATDKHFFT